MSWRAQVDPGWDLDRWRGLARHAWEAQLAPEQVDWEDQRQAGLLPSPPVMEAPRLRTGLSVPAAFMELAGRVVCHRAADRHALLYRLLWRIGQGERGLLQQALDADVHRLRGLEKAVGRDLHKMKAFVRFRAVPGQDNTFAAWFEPEHCIVDRIAPFFLRRFAGMRWSIHTPYRSVLWDGQALWAGDGGERSAVPDEDADEGLWQTYYASTFNPARLNTRMMRQEMPQKYWHLLPETHLLPELVRTAGERVQAMAERAHEPARRRIPARRNSGAAD